MADPLVGWTEFRQGYQTPTWEFLTAALKPRFLMASATMSESSLCRVAGVVFLTAWDGGGGSEITLQYCAILSLERSKFFLVSESSTCYWNMIFPIYFPSTREHEHQQGPDQDILPHPRQDQCLPGAEDHQEAHLQVQFRALAIFRGGKFWTQSFSWITLPDHIPLKGLKLPSLNLLNMSTEQWPHSTTRILSFTPFQTLLPWLWLPPSAHRFREEATDLREIQGDSAHLW